jgi:hypothetical protein
MRIRQDQLADFLTETLLNIRLGLQQAKAKGIVVRMPKSITVQAEVVQTRNAFTSEQTSEQSAVNTHDEQDRSETYSESKGAGSGEVSTQNYTFE